MNRHPLIFIDPSLWIGLPELSQKYLARNINTFRLGSWPGLHLLQGNECAGKLSFDCYLAIDFGAAFEYAKGGKPVH